MDLIEESQKMFKSGFDPKPKKIAVLVYFIMNPNRWRERGR